MNKEKEHTEKISAKSKTHGEQIKWFCEFCTLIFTSEIQAQQHFVGKKHQNVLKNKSRPKKEQNFKMESRVARKNLFYKNLKETYSKKPFCDNYTGLKYAMNDLRETIPPPAGRDNILETVIKNEKKNISASDLSIFRTPSGKYYCQPCNLTVNSPAQFLQHSESRKHKHRASKMSCKLK